MRTFNPQLSTSSAQPGSTRILRPWTLNVECWLLNVSRFAGVAFLLVAFTAPLPAAEPALTNAVATAVSNNLPAKPAAPVTRSFSESDLLALLTSTLQSEYVKDKGELELRLSRPWTARTVPDEILTIKVLDIPAMGVTPTFILRFELRTAEQSLGTWQASVQARVWRDVWIAQSPLKRGDLVANAALDRQRRDVLTLREMLADFAPGDSTLELAEPLQSGSPLLARSVKIRPVIRRGQSADALVQDGALSITMKVEALEDGAPGQIIRARNSQTRRDLRGKVLNENTILLTL
ncbi:MAG: flagellar basal body P-ring formation protein FlgA [Akkermansiaceae bacterium]|nr:flagellar basal body P-ring formation protein FlgA [Verrucomicrobiales bacterium]